MDRFGYTIGYMNMRNVFILSACTLLNACTTISYDGLITRYVDCNYDADGRCIKPMFNMLNSDNHKLSIRANLGKKYLLQYKYKF